MSKISPNLLMFLIIFLSKFFTSAQTDLNKHCTLTSNFTSENVEMYFFFICTSLEIFEKGDSSAFFFFQISTILLMFLIIFEAQRLLVLIMIWANITLVLHWKISHVVSFLFVLYQKYMREISPNLIIFEALLLLVLTLIWTNMSP